jgi:formamidopyrimidine-DNA glycosylase
MMAQYCQGKLITSVIAVEQGGGARDGLFDDIIHEGAAGADAVVKALVGRRIVSTHRKGKQQWYRLDGPGRVCLLSHFGMTGNWSIFTKGTSTSGSKYQR